MTPGRHVLFVSHEGYKTREMLIDVIPKKSMTVRPELEERTGKILPKDFHVDIPKQRTEQASLELMSRNFNKVFDTQLRPSTADLTRIMNTKPDIDGFNFTPAQREAQNRASFERVIRLVNTLHEAPMPTVSAINGVAAGGGAGIALGCDVVLMKRSARFVLTFVPKLGIVPDVAATWLLARAGGRAKAMAASLLGDSISADQAERWGLVWKTIDDDAFDAEVKSVCERLANTPQQAVRDTRKLVDLATEMPLREHIGIERDLQVHLVGGPDFVEGVTAFREKRAPKFDAR